MTDKTLPTIVVIDDDYDDLEIMTYVINKVEPKASCVTFTHPRVAINELQSKPDLCPDYIFIDFNMPTMRGDECLQAIRKIERLRDSIIVMISTYMPEAIKRKLYAAGANYTFEKPRSIQDYYAFMKNLIVGETVQDSKLSF